MKKDNWLLENRKLKWYDIAFIGVYIVLAVMTIGIIILGQSL